MNTLLVIGGTGFFGKSILDSYKRGLLSIWNIRKIIILSRNATNFQYEYPELVTEGVELLDNDIATAKYLPNADFVIHAAASTKISRYLSKNGKEQRNIIEGTINYCRLAKKFHKNSKIVYCSSGAVYGHQSKDIKFLEEFQVLGDISKLDAEKKSYALAKRDAEIAIQELARNNFNVTIARCFAFVGKYLPKDQHFAISNFIANGINGKDIDVKADKLVYRSYLYADDLVEWLLTIAENANPKCPIYNVGSDNEIEIRDLAEIISKMFNVGVNSLNNSNNTKVDRYIPSIAKAQKELGLRDNYKISSSILNSVK